MSLFRSSCTYLLYLFLVFIASSLITLPILADVSNLLSVSFAHPNHSFFSNIVRFSVCLFAPNVTGVGGFLLLNIPRRASNNEISLCDGKHFISFASKRAVCLICWFCLCFRLLSPVNFASNFELFSVSVLCRFFLVFLVYLQTGRNVYAETFCVYRCR